MKYLFAFLLLLATVTSSQAQTCLSYWSVGAAACKKKEEETPPPPPPPQIMMQPPVVAPQPVTPTVVIQPEPKKELSEKEKLEIQVEKEVDEFLENHGKPPREFARFMINPTLENALIWAQKYDDMLKRTEETTVAWMKAQHILKEKKAGNLNTEIPTLEKTRRAVPDYGIEWNSEEDKFQEISKQEQQGSIGVFGSTETLSDEGRISGFQQQSSSTQQANTEPNLDAATMYAMMGQLQQQGADMAAPGLQQPNQPAAAQTDGEPKMDVNAMLGMLQQLQQQQGEMANNQNVDTSAPTATVTDLKSLLPNAEMVEDGKIHVNYYFSAECPYCKKFEPGLQQVIDELGDGIQVTCVDMTPSSKDVINIYGKVDCDWRPLMPNEMSTFKIKSTPTILVNFPGKTAIERLEGAVSAANLKAYLRKN